MIIGALYTLLVLYILCGIYGSFCLVSRYRDLDDKVAWPLSYKNFIITLGIIGFILGFMIVFSALTEFLEDSIYIDDSDDDDDDDDNDNKPVEPINRNDKSRVS